MSEPRHRYNLLELLDELPASWREEDVYDDEDGFYRPLTPDDKRAVEVYSKGGGWRARINGSASVTEEVQALVDAFYAQGDFPDRAFPTHHAAMAAVDDFFEAHPFTGSSPQAEGR